MLLHGYVCVWGGGLSQHPVLVLSVRCRTEATTWSYWQPANIYSFEQGTWSSHMTLFTAYCVKTANYIAGLA